MGMFMVALAFMAAASGPAPLQVGDRLPPLRGQFLTGRDVTLPDATEGRAAVLLMGFTYASRTPVEAWGAWFRTTFEQEPGVTFFEMPIIGGPAKLARWFIDSGMRRGTPASLHEHVITVYSKSGDWKTRMGVTPANDKDAFVVLLDSQGMVRWLHRGGFDQARADELREAVGRVLP
jgi:hypothetical protein